ncbi:hypothetical protein NK8_83670 (plasmid) [Caballeronia sp. NK8]|nr:hypothetical protein NK8_83670 [Caballeronia sp. NK8]
MRFAARGRPTSAQSDAHGRGHRRRDSLQLYTNLFNNTFKTDIDATLRPAQLRHPRLQCNRAT